MARARLALLVSVLLAAAVVPVLAQARLEASVTRARVQAGSVFRITYEVRGGVATQFLPPSGPGFEVVAGPSQVSSLLIDNGRTTREQRYTLDVVADQPGRLVIPGAVALIDRQDVRSNQLELKVTAAPPPATQTSGAEVELRYVASATRVYVGERFTVAAELVHRVDIYTYTMLRAPEYGRLRVEELRTFASRARTFEFGGATYQAQGIYAVDAYATQPGTYTIPPHSLRVNVLVDGRRGSFYYGPQTRPVTVRTAPLTIEVLPLPTPAPADFGGAVGRWRFSGEFVGRPARLTTADALTFELTAEGRGDMTRLQAPTIAWPEGWQAYPPELTAEKSFETDSGVVARREFTYTLVPEQGGSFVLRPRVTYFDVGTEAYTTVAVDSLVVLVAGPAASSSDREAASREAEAGAPEIYRGRPRVVRGYWIAEPWFWLIAVLGPLLMLGWRYRARLRLRLSGGTAALARPRDPLAEGRRRLAAARASIDEPAQFYEELARALDAFARDRLGLGIQEQTPAGIRAAFAKTRGAGATPVYGDARARAVGGEAQASGEFSKGDDARQWTWGSAGGSFRARDSRTSDAGSGFAGTRADDAGAGFADTRADEASGGFADTRADEASGGFADTRADEASAGSAGTRADDARAGFVGTRLGNTNVGFAGTRSDDPAEAFLRARVLVERGRFGGGIDRAGRQEALEELERALSVG